MAATYTARNNGMRGGTVEREKALEVALLQIEKQFGKGSVMRMGVDGPADPVQAISTGSLALDLALGIGGVPRGRVVEIYGPEASGKTTLALHIIAEAQKAGGIAAFVDSEHALDVTYARNLGVNADELLISQPDTGEQALEIADMLIRSGAIDVIVIDSVAALVPRAEIEGEMGDSHVGLQARLMSQALRKLSGTISKSKTTAVFINQLREKIGILFGSPETTSGGRALKFYASVRLDVRRIEALKDGPRGRRQPDQGQGGQEQAGPALPLGRVRRHLRPGDLQGGEPARRRRGRRPHQEVGGLVHLRRRPARPGTRELPQLPPRQPRARPRDRGEDQGPARRRPPTRPPPVPDESQPQAKDQDQALSQTVWSRTPLALRPPRPGTDRPAGHGKTDASLGQLTTCWQSQFGQGPDLRHPLAPQVRTSMALSAVVR